MHHVFAKAGKLVLAWLIILGLAAMASLGISLSAGSLRSATPSPAEIVASRFPSSDATLPVMPATFSHTLTQAQIQSLVTYIASVAK